MRQYLTETSKKCRRIWKKLRGLDKMRPKEVKKDWCRRCGRYREVKHLNIEAAIHHGGSIECFDRKACGRHRKRIKKWRHNGTYNRLYS